MVVGGGGGGRVAAKNAASASTPGQHREEQEEQQSQVICMFVALPGLGVLFCQYIKLEPSYRERGWSCRVQLSA